MTTIALTKDIFDTHSQATASHHVLGMYQVDLVNKRTHGVMLAFISPLASQPVFRTNFALPGLPVGDGQAWLYEQLLHADNQLDANAFAGAVAVTAVEGDA